MAGQSFKDLIAWKKAHSLAVDIYQEFSSCKDFSFRDQIQRASVSIMNNIAEGCGRRSDNTFRHFLKIAKGSAAEVESMLILAASLGYIDQSTQQKLLEQTEETSKILSGFIKKL